MKLLKLFSIQTRSYQV